MGWWSRLWRLARPEPGVETTSIDVAGIGRLTLSGRPGSDPYIFGRLRRGEMFEPHILAVIAALTPPGAAFIDVGANIGVFTLCAARLAGPRGQVLAVEPAPDNLTLLRRNIRQNAMPGRTRVRVLAAAASDAEGSASLSLSLENAGDHRLGSRSRTGGEKVRTTRLDTARLPAGQPLVMKFDIQGAETAALRGLSGILAPGSPRTIRALVEFWPFGLADCGSSAEDLIAVLEANFSRLWLIWSHCPPLPATPDELRRLATDNLAPRTEMFADIVALRAGDAAGIEAMRKLSGEDGEAGQTV